MKFVERLVDLITTRLPLPVRYYKLLRSISKIAKVRLITGSLNRTMHLGMNLNTIATYAVLICKVFNSLGPAIIDNVVLHSTLMRKKRNIVIDFRTPFSYELAWLKHKTLALLAHSFERILKDVGLVFAANERMAVLCKELGADFVQVIPNYPTRSFKPTVESEKWKATYGLGPADHIVLFTGGTRLREIYGLDLLLSSWKIVEESKNSCFLVILGDDSIPYIRRKVQTMSIKRLLLPGRVSTKSVANWINCSDVCVAPRTPGFPKVFYDDKDSTKISEYAALEKPIVAAGYAPSNQYLLVDQTPEALAEGIMKGLEGRINRPKPHYWEENEPLILNLLENFWF